jgi:DNA polymerase III subunit alpha
MAKVISKRNVFLREAGMDFIDADIDFSNNPLTDKGRDYILQNLAKKYNVNGNIHFALVGVRTVYSIKSALRDIARTYDVPASETFAVTKEIDDSYNVEENIKRSKIFSEYNRKYPEVVRIASQIVGVTSNFGVHAGGVVISDKAYPLQKYVPLQRSHSGIPATLYDKDELQDVCGFIKYDLLGVTALSQILYVKYLLGDNTYYEDYKVNLEPFTLCKKGAHKNIFQFESPLGKRSFTDLKMESIYDLSNASGMIRQMGTEGGRAMYEKYKILSNSAEEQWISTLKEEVSEELFEIIYPILKPTYGVLIYQEQLSSMIQKISKEKYSFGDGNSVRKKLSKFVGKHGLVDSLQGKPELLRAWHTDMIDILGKYLIPFLSEKDIGIVGRKFINFELDNKGHLPLPENGILNWFIIGSTYLFSVIHSVAYSFISYNQLYQKYYHPTEFWLGALSTGSKDDISNYVSSATSESKITFLKPDINKSKILFSKEDELTIRFGLSYIAGMDKAAHEIINERERNGEFKNFVDFITRMKGIRVVNKRIIENLIFSNSFDEDAKECYDKYCSIKGELSELKWTKKEMINRERDALNCNISYSSINKEDLINTVPIEIIMDGQTGLTAFSISSIKSAKTKKAGKPYRILSVIDLNNGNKCTIFLWENSIMLEEGMAYRAKIKKNGDFYSWTL